MSFYELPNRVTTLATLQAQKEKTIILYRKEEKPMIDRSKIKPGSIWEGARLPREMEVREAKWIIPQVLPRGCITELFGPPEVGKSTLLGQTAVDLASGTITIFDDPDTWQGRDPLKVAYIDAEESDTYITNPRILKMISRENENLVTFTKEHVAVAGLTTTSEAMKDLCEGTEGFRPDVIIIAPIEELLPDRCNAMKKKDVAKALQPLVVLAEKNDCAIVIMQHTNKVKDIDYRRCLSNSSAFSEAPRSIIMMGELPNGKIFCSLEKASLNRKHEKYHTRILEFRKDIQKLQLVGTTPKRWRDFYLDQQAKDNADIGQATNKALKITQLEENKAIILQVLKENGGSMVRGNLLIAIAEAGATNGRREQAIKALKDAGEIIATDVYNGKSRETTYKLSNVDDGVLRLDNVEIFPSSGRIMESF